MMVLMTSMFIVSLMLSFVFSMIMDKSQVSFQKLVEFECGFNSIVMNRLPFSLQYFMISVLFLVFDLEIILIMPVIEESKKQYIMIIFLMILLLMLILGLFVEWMYGLVDWSK